jgi:DedD protein
VDSLVKERLTGAIILVALIVLLVPELLTGPIRSAPAAARAPVSAEEPPLRSYKINLGDDTRAEGAAIQPSAPAPTASSPAPPPSPAPMAAAQASPAPVAAPAPAAPAQSAPSRPASTPSPPPGAPAAAGSAWVVQLGSFASRANAERLAQQVRSRGFQVGVSRAASGRALYRVRVGPVRDRAAAVQLQAKLRTAGHGGSVVPK